MPSDKNKDIAAQVAARVAAENDILAASQKPTAVAALEITDDFILECLRANRVGDATLFSTLFKGKFVYVKRWGRWLRWVGHHWQDDIEDISEAAIEEVCRLYLRVAEKKQQEADEESDKELKKRPQDIADSAVRRVNLLRDKSGRENLLTLAHKIECPWRGSFGAYTGTVECNRRAFM